MPKTELMRQLLKNWKGFDIVLNKLKIVSAGNGNCTGTLVIDNDHTNAMGGLHGGLSATIVDIVSTLALLTHEKGECVSVSVNINTSFMKGAKIGDEIVVDAKTLRVGETMAFLNCEIRNKKTKDLLIMGKHTKCLLH